MRRLRERVRTQGDKQRAATASLQPSGTSPQGGVSGSAASPPGPDAMPLAEVLVYPYPGGGYSAVAYRGLTPIFTSDGAAVPATGAGSWGQVRAAGRP